MFGLLIIIVFLPIVIPFFVGIIEYRKNKNIWISIKRAFMLLFIFSFLCSIFASLSGSEYYKQIDPVDFQRYTAISGEYALTFLAYNILYLLSIITVCVKGRNLPPLALSLGIIFITI